MAQPDPRAPAPRRLLLRACLQVVLTAIVLTAIYYALPLSRQPAPGPSPGSRSASSASPLSGRSTCGRSCVPGTRAAGDHRLRCRSPLFVLVFASTYLALVADAPGALSKDLSHTDVLYFTVTVFSTVRFGDITPISQSARIAVTIQMIGGLIVLGGLASRAAGAGVLRAAVRVGRADRVALRLALGLAHEPISRLLGPR